MSRREFHFQEGNSSKFWAIEVGGPRFTVQFGRLGTAGQTQTKEFKSDAEAKAAADKLIAEKTKKGYAEVGAAAAPAKAAKPKPAAAAPAAALVPAAPAALEIVRRIDAEPPDWLSLPGQPWQSRPRPAPKPFDLKDALDRFRRAVGEKTSWRTDWTKARIAPSLTPPEARFWLEAMALTKTYEKTAPMVQKLDKIDYDKPLTEKQVIDRLRAWKRDAYPGAEVAIPLSHLLPLERFCDLILHWKTAGRDHWEVSPTLAEGFLLYVRPYLPADEATALRDEVRPRLDPSRIPGDDLSGWYLAAYLGMGAELVPAVANFPDGSFANAWNYGSYESSGTAVVLVLNLPDGALAESEARRLQVRLMAPDAVAGWLIRTRWHALDYVRDNILALSDKPRAERLVSAFTRVHAPEAAPYMLQLMLESKAPGAARQWLDENPGNAIAGLIPVAGGQGKLADAALEYLGDAKKKGHAGFIAEQLKSAPRDAAERVRQQVLEREEKVYTPFDAKTTPRWLHGALGAAPAGGKASPLADPTRLPPILVGANRLNDDQARAVLAALTTSLLGAPHPVLPALKEHADRASLDAFAWRLFELWLAYGAPSKEKWAFLALGHLGGDGVALKLTPLLRAWPGEGQHQRAVTGLECLRAIGSDTALMQLNGIAQRVKFKGLQNKARELMEAIAKDRKLTRDQLEDRIVPDLGLDQRGGRTFDFGPRRFELLLGPDLRPLVRGEDRKPREDLPKPGAKDDAAKASAAAAEWKVLKKALREAAKVQAFRLEQAMVVGRRWSPDEFKTLLVRHPLMVNLVRRLLWGGYDGQGKLARAFRVTEESEYADADDRPCALDGVASVGVVHPLHLSEAERAKWGQVFGDYEIIPPFPQLGRAVLGLEGNEPKAQEITRFAGKKVPGVSVASYLEKSGWQRGPLHDHGDFYEHYKYFPGADATAMTEYDGPLWAGNIAELGAIAVKSCTFWPGGFVPDWLRGPDYKKALKLGDVDPVVMSEVLADLTFLASKAE